MHIARNAWSVTESANLQNCFIGMQPCRAFYDAPKRLQWRLQPSHGESSRHTGISQQGFQGGEVMWWGEAVACLCGAGPLEATIANLSREIEAAATEGHALQMQWVTLQSELLALAASNSAAAEQISRDTSTRAVMEHRLERLDRQ